RFSDEDDPAWRLPEKLWTTPGPLHTGSAAATRETSAYLDTRGQRGRSAYCAQAGHEIARAPARPPLRPHYDHHNRLRARATISAALDDGALYTAGFLASDATRISRDPPTSDRANRSGSLAEHGLHRDAAKHSRGAGQRP